MFTHEQPQRLHFDQALLHNENLRLHAYIFLTERPYSQIQVYKGYWQMSFNYTAQCGNFTTWWTDIKEEICTASPGLLVRHWHSEAKALAAQQAWQLAGHGPPLIAAFARPKSPVVPTEQEQPGSCVRKHPLVLSWPNVDPPAAWLVELQWGRLVGDKVTRGWKAASCWATPLFPHFMEASCGSISEEMAINALAADCHQH